MQTQYLPAMFAFDRWSWKRTYSVGEGTGVAMETPVGKQEVSEKRGCDFCVLALVHLLKEFVGGIFIAVVLHLTELPFLWAQHWVHLQQE